MASYSCPDELKDKAAASWFGYGRWEAEFWFIGMEPGGDDARDSYEAWADLDRKDIGLVDCREHHLWKRDVRGIVDPDWTRWHEDRPGRRTQPTWRRLIQTLLAFKEKSTDLDAVYTYQKYQLGRASDDGETALLELGALHAPGLATNVDRVTFRDARIKILHDRLIVHHPTFAICYGYGFREQFERVIGAMFDVDGFAWSGPTLCFLAPGPTSFLRDAPTPWSSASWWIEKGNLMRALISSRA